MFSIGDKVLCIDDSCNDKRYLEFKEWIKMGRIYTIRSLVKDPSNYNLYIRLEEIILPIIYNIECAIHQSKFKKIDYNEDKLNNKIEDKVNA